MSNGTVELKSKYFLNDKWGNPKPIRSLYKHLEVGKKPPVSWAILAKKGSITPEQELKEWIESVRIEVAEAAETTKLSSDEKNEYLKTELGMNIIVPKGNIEKLRFKVNLKANESSDEVVAIDGLPNDLIKEKEIVGGKIKIGITKLFKFIPIVGGKIPELLDIELNPWEFKLGKIKRVSVDFSGGLTSKPEWFFKKDGIKNDLRVALTIRKPKNTAKIDGEVTAAWIYKAGIFGEVVIRSEDKIIRIY